MKHTNCFRFLGVVPIALLTFSCVGEIGKSGAPGASDNSSPTGSNNRGGRGVSEGAGPNTAPPGRPSGTVSVAVPGVPAAACGAAPDPGYVGLRRLTRVEYDNTVRDLLGDASRPAAAFPNDDSILAAQSQVSSLYFEKHENAAERLVNEAWLREAASKQSAATRLMVCPLSPGDTACARAIVTAFARRAWRRPVTAAEMDPYVALVAVAEKHGEDTAAGVKLALQAVLEALDFLFRVELDVSPAARALTPHELAVRLSYLLWSTMPDKRLSEVADNGTLAQPAVLGAEMARMLSDAKASAFADGFVGHWLSLGSFASSQPDPTLSGGFDEPLRQAMTAETISVFRAFLDEGLSFARILDADFTFMNDRLARHYGIAAPAASGPAANLRRISLPPGPRRGLLGHGGLLTMTSGPTNTSPVKRGKFVSTFLLCTKPPAPPPGVDTLPKEAGHARTERERLAIHRANPQCAGCHALMDPIGLGLENFDLVGRHRRAYANGAAIDVSGALPGGGTFNTFEDLRGMLSRDERVPACVANQLFVYAIGREMGDADECVRKGMMERFTASGRLTDLLAALAGSPPFAGRRAETAGGSL